MPFQDLVMPYFNASIKHSCLPIRGFVHNLGIKIRTLWVTLLETFQAYNKAFNTAVKEYGAKPASQ